MYTCTLYSLARGSGNNFRFGVQKKYNSRSVILTLGDATYKKSIIAELFLCQFFYLVFLPLEFLTPQSVLTVVYCCKVQYILYLCIYCVMSPGRNRNRIVQKAMKLRKPANQHSTIYFQSSVLPFIYLFIHSFT